MADSKLSALTALTTPTPDDLLYVVDDPAGIATSKKITFGNLESSLTVANQIGGTATGTGNIVRANSPSLVTPDIGVASGTGKNLVVERIAGSTYSTVQHIQDLFHSTGWTSGGTISDAGSGVITVTSGTGLIRATDSDVATIYFTDFPASSPANVTLTDQVDNYIYVEYNAGSPRIIATTSIRTDYNTNFRIGNVYRNGTTLHINQTDKMAVSDHAGKMIRFNQEVMPYAHVSGASISETGTRNFALTAGSFWMGLVKFSTASFDSAVASTFTYYYRAVSGWTAVTSQTQINNTQYDNGTGTLATLSNNKYGVHWVYLSADNHVYVVYGQGDYTLVQAQDATAPASLPVEITSHGFIAGKIIILKSASTFTSVESAFNTTFMGSVAVNHNDLGGLQGGTANEYYHLTSAEYTGTGTGNFVKATSPTLVTPLLGTPTSGTLTNCTGLPIAGLTPSTSTAIGVGSIELGHATDTTIARVSAGVISVEGVTMPSISSTDTLTNKRITKRVVTVNAPGATPTTNTDNGDIMEFTGLAVAITSMTTNLSGTPTNGQMIEFIFVDDGTARAITWGTSFASGGIVSLPTTTVISTPLRVLLQYQTIASLNKWVCIAVA